MNDKHTFYVETVRHPFYGKQNAVKVDFNVFRADKFSVDCLSPSVTAVFRVDHVKNATEAVSCIMESAAGLGPSVTLVYGGRKREAV